METRLYIDGAWSDAKDGATFAVKNPATGEKLATCADAGGADARRAIESAHKAFRPWAQTVARQRGALLDRAFRLMIERREDLARTLTEEEGKPLAEARGEIDYAASFLEWYAQEAMRLYGDVIPANVPGKRQMAIRQPVGVVGAITPWNFPSAMITRKVAPALAAGCTVIIKPAEQTPLSAVKLFEIFHEVGFPPGVLNMLTTARPAPVGQEMLTNQALRKISFTGSTEIGKFLMRESAAQVKRLSLELGGHAPFVVFEDADLDKAVDAAVYTKFRNMGQTCISTNRYYVQASVVEKFLGKFVERVKALKVGNGLEEGVQVGPLIDSGVHGKVMSHIEDARAKGARVECGGGALTKGALSRGHFVAPTVLTGVTPKMQVFQEETFGPVAPIATFRTEDEALAMANSSVYGLAAYFWTRDVGRSLRFAEGLEFGIIGCNDQVPTGSHAPFGGVKESGMGREGGHFGIEEFTDVKFISIGL